MVVSGPGGIGTNTLATHWAYTAADRFPDGQFYVDLRGFSGTSPRDRAETVTLLLVAIGVPVESAHAAAL